MPSVSRFLGIVIKMYFDEGEQHHLPHLHAEYAGDEAVFNIDTGEKIAGKFPPKQTLFVQTWVLLHQEELMENWKLVSADKPIIKIKPLR